MLYCLSAVLACQFMWMCNLSRRSDCVASIVYWYVNARFLTRPTLQGHFPSIQSRLSQLVRFQVLHRSSNCGIGKLAWQRSSIRTFSSTGHICCRDFTINSFQGIQAGWFSGLTALQTLWGVFPAFSLLNISLYPKITGRLSTLQHTDWVVLFADISDFAVCWVFWVYFG